jgi:ribose transport system permease protein
MSAAVRRHGTVLTVYAMVLLIFVVTAIFSPGFASSTNVATLLTEASFIGLVGLGQTFVIIGGGIDLSVPAVMTTSAVLLTRFVETDGGRLVWVLPLLLLGCVVVGLVNGIGVSVLGISPIVMTLAVQSLVTGLLLVQTQGASGDNVVHQITTLSTTKVIGIPVEVCIWAVVGAFAAFVLARTAYARRLYAVGTSSVVAELAGVRLRRVTITAYVISAVASGLAGVLFAGYAGQSYLTLGDPYLFPSIAAVAIGGASILGGSGSYVGTVGGALLLAVLGGLLPVLGLKTAWLLVVYGVVILVAVGVSGIRRAEEASA